MKPHRNLRLVDVVGSLALAGRQAMTKSVLQELNTVLM
jgi:hypothetical protein